MTRRGQLPAAPGTHDAEMLRTLSDRELFDESTRRMEDAERRHVLAGQHLADVDRAQVHADPAFGRAWAELRRRSERDAW